MSGRTNTKMFQTMVRKHGSEEAARAWYANIGRRGGLATLESHGSIKGFGRGEEGRALARRVGAIGGKKSKRRPRQKVGDGRG